jgi:hypothetical protein
MSDRELLEAAAKAAGRTILQDPHGRFRDCTGAHHSAMNIFSFPLWNPLTDDGDALRLAVKLCLVVCVLRSINFTGVYLPAENIGGKYDITEPHKDDPLAATRRAVTRAAAEIGKGMP